MKTIRMLYLFFISIAVSQLSAAQAPDREFRGIWIATVNNIDWPSKPGLPVEQQKNELIAMLNQLDSLHFNAVIFQIRPAGDAFYQSKSEPWSQWLNGTQGEAPKPFWDPLQFMVEECHRRGMELHAWMNPYRLSQSSAARFSSKSIAMRHPEWVVSYGNKQYLDPGIPGVRNYLSQVVREVVQNYNVDAIHFDDYFYPYPIAGTDFPDSTSFKQHSRGFAFADIDQWRRENVDLIIEQLHQTIRQTKPKVKFGISPFGVWKNFDENDEIGGSATTAGNTNYDNLYADVINWQRKGWIDYMIPQLYWEIGHKTVDFITLANWWSERSFGHHVYIGHALYKLIEGSSEAWKNERELPEQILIARRMKNIQGSAYFRMRFLEKNPMNFTSLLEEEVYTHRALLPVMPWLDKQAPPMPDKVKAKGLFKKDEIKVKYRNKTPKASDHLGYIVYASSIEQSPMALKAENIAGFMKSDHFSLDALQLPDSKKVYLWLTVIDQHHNESPASGPIKIKVKQ
ncbi:glycoside hydrolase family 10 protein [Roseimarinus sediminis]|uniref:glycoside hydrolase family 10 protein n=1 Tax=Roseimarinus sediminis TaxID=1610899 RepID=UPI003D215DF5